MSQDPEKLAEGTLISHLLELRDRLLRALIAVGIAFVPCILNANDLFSFVAQPLLQKLPAGSNLIATGVMSPFTTPFKLSFFAAVLIAMPYVIYQLWAFVAPGLYRKERRFAVPLLVSSILLFYVGIAFAYYFVFPVMFQFFAAHDAEGRGDDDRHQQLPGLRAHHVLLLRARLRGAGGGGAAGGHGDRARREPRAGTAATCCIGIFILAALLTPPDAIAQCSLAIPMYAPVRGRHRHGAPPRAAQGRRRERQGERRLSSPGFRSRACVAPAP